MSPFTTRGAHSRTATLFVVTLSGLLGVTNKVRGHLDLCFRAKPGKKSNLGSCFEKVTRSQGALFLLAHGTTKNAELEVQIVTSENWPQMSQAQAFLPHRRSNAFQTRWHRQVHLVLKSSDRQLCCMFGRLHSGKQRKESRQSIARLVRTNQDRSSRRNFTPRCRAKRQAIEGLSTLNESKAKEEKRT